MLALGHESQLYKGQLDRFCRFCRAHDREQCTDTPTQTTPRQYMRSNSLASVLCMRRGW